MADPDYVGDDEFSDIHQALGLRSIADTIGRHRVLQIVPEGLPMGVPSAGAPKPPMTSNRAPDPAPKADLPEGYSLEPSFSGYGHYLHAPNGDLVDFGGQLSALRASAQRHLETGQTGWGTAPEVTPAPAQRSSVESVLASPTREGYNALTAPERQDYMSRVFFSAPHEPFSTTATHMENLLGERAGSREVNGSSAPNWDAWMDHYYGQYSRERDPAVMEQKRILALNPGASIADVAGIPQPPAARTAHDLPPELGWTSGALGDLPKAVRDNIAAKIGPHMSEAEFADKYFGGMYHPDNFTAGNGGEITSTGNSLKFAGRLRDPISGANIGSIDRTINPDYAYHGYLKVDPSARGTGAVPAMLSNQVDLYKKMGLSEVRLGANIDVGSYAWAKYGFVPKTQGDWDYLRGRTGVGRDWQDMKPHVDPDQAEHVDRILADPDPHAIWDLADVPYKAPEGFGRDDNTTIGKALLMNKSWSGKLDLNGADSMQRFNDYVKSKMK